PARGPAEPATGLLHENAALDARLPAEVDVPSNRAQPAAHVGGLEGDLSIDVLQATPHIGAALEIHRAVHGGDLMAHVRPGTERDVTVDRGHRIRGGVRADIDPTVHGAGRSDGRAVVDPYGAVDGPDGAAVLPRGHMDRAVDRAGPALGRRHVSVDAVAGSDRHRHHAQHGEQAITPHVGFLLRRERAADSVNSAGQRSRAVLRDALVDPDSYAITMEATKSGPPFKPCVPISGTRLTSDRSVRSIRQPPSRRVAPGSRSCRAGDIDPGARSIRVSNGTPHRAAGVDHCAYGTEPITAAGRSDRC